MKYLLILFTLLILPVTSYTAQQQIRIAVIDTGLDLQDPRFNGHLCTSGHRDLTYTTLNDVEGHGTHIAGLIQQNAEKGNYCLIILKYWQRDVDGTTSLIRIKEAYKEAIIQHVDIVNVSAGGPEFNEEEYLLIKNNPDITFVVAAGNDGKSLDIKGNEYYPASYNLWNEIVVGNKTSDGMLASTSNWGKNIKTYEVGENAISTLPNGKYGALSGTSMSTAIYTGKLIRKILNAK